MKKTVLHDEKVFRADAVERENFFSCRTRRAMRNSQAALHCQGLPFGQDGMDTWLHNQVENARRPGSAVNRSG